jgi:hypothetical protein
MYSRSAIERPATSEGACAEGGMDSGKLVEMTPEGDNASRRRAIKVEVNHDGRLKALWSSTW